jgi:ApaG protein
MLEHVYSELTNDIEVEVVPLFVPDQTQFVNQYLYTYNISITNHSKGPCQLLRRHWIIVDGNGQKDEVEGEGVVGEQPLIAPGQTYQYSSYCPLPTSTGNMRGAFEFIDSKKQKFWVKVPLFFLRQDLVMQ